MNFLNAGKEAISLLKVHEWVAIALVTGIIGGVACLTSFAESGEAGRIPSVNLSKQYKGFDVLVKGAVAYPGIYHLPAEMKMKDLLDLAEVAVDADLRRFRLEGVVKKGRIVNVPVRAMIKVYLRGAVKRDQALSIPKNSKLSDLMQIGEFSADADLGWLNRKRRIKPDEVIVVPVLKK